MRSHQSCETMDLNVLNYPTYEIIFLKTLIVVFNCLLIILKKCTNLTIFCWWILIPENQNQFRVYFYDHFQKYICLSIFCRWIPIHNIILYDIFISHKLVYIQINYPQELWFRIRVHVRLRRARQQQFRHIFYFQWRNSSVNNIIYLQKGHIAQSLPKTTHYV